MNSKVAFQYMAMMFMSQQIWLIQDNRLLLEVTEYVMQSLLFSIVLFHPFLLANLKFVFFCLIMLFRLGLTQLQTMIGNQNIIMEMC